MGVTAFIGQISLGAEDFAAMKAEERALYENIPLWATIAFALAVFGGALGCLFMLLRKSLAIQILQLSLAGIFVQMIYNFFISGAFDVYGPGGMIMPVMVILIGIGLVFFANYSKRNGWLT